MCIRDRPRFAPHKAATSNAKPIDIATKRRCGQTNGNIRDKFPTEPVASLRACFLADPSALFGELEFGWPFCVHMKPRSVQLSANSGSFWRRCIRQMCLHSRRCFRIGARLVEGLILSPVFLPSLFDRCLCRLQQPQTTPRRRARAVCVREPTSRSSTPKTAAAVLWSRSCANIADSFHTATSVSYTHLTLPTIYPV